MAGKIQSVLYNVDQTDDTSVDERKQAQQNILGYLSDHAGKYLKVNEDGDGIDFAEGGGGSGAIIEALPASDDDANLDQFNRIKGYIDEGKNVILFGNDTSGVTYWTYGGSPNANQLVFYSYKSSTLNALYYDKVQTGISSFKAIIARTTANLTKIFNANMDNKYVEISAAYSNGIIPILRDVTYGTAQYLSTFLGPDGLGVLVFIRVDPDEKRIVVTKIGTTDEVERTYIPLSQNVFITKSNNRDDINAIIDANLLPVLVVGGGQSGYTAASYYPLQFKSFNSSATPPTYKYIFTASDVIDRSEEDSNRCKYITVEHHVLDGDVRVGGTWTYTESIPWAYIELDDSQIAKSCTRSQLQTFINKGAEIIVKYKRYASSIYGPLFYRYSGSIDNSTTGDKDYIFTATYTNFNSTPPKTFIARLRNHAGYPNTNHWDSGLADLDLSSASIGDAGSTNNPVYIIGGVPTSCWFSISKTLGQDPNTIYLI